MPAIVHVEFFKLQGMTNVFKSLKSLERYTRDLKGFLSNLMLSVKFCLSKMIVTQSKNTEIAFFGGATNDVEG